MAKNSNFHEAMARGQEPEGGSNRQLGIVFAVVLTLLSGWAVFTGKLFWPWTLGAGALFLLAGLVFPRVLTPVNFVWTKFGMLLHCIVSPIILGIIFFIVVTPVGLLMRLTGKDPMDRKFDPEAKTYWIDRDPPGPAPESMKNQF